MANTGIPRSNDVWHHTQLAKMSFDENILNLLAVFFLGGRAGGVNINMRDGEQSGDRV